MNQIEYTENSSLKLRYILYSLICLTILIKFIAASNTILISDGALYGQIAFNLLNTKWYSLVQEFKIDWLDKPHLVFWILAFAFKVFGVSAKTYNMCALFVTLIGGYFVYRLARLFYTKNLSLIGLLIYLNFMEINNSLISPKLEPYLLLFIIGGIFFIIKFCLNAKTKYFVLAAICASGSIMTKGYFGVIMTFSTYIALYYYSKPISESVSYLKLSINLFWQLLLFLLLALCFTIPAIFAYYLQFGIPGIEFFLYKSQFGRFAQGDNWGHNYIISYYGGHIPSMILGLIFGMLPFSFIFIYELITRYKRNLNSNTFLELAILSPICMMTLIFITSFYYNLYYNVILMPFVAIYCIRFFLNKTPNIAFHYFLQVIAVLIILLTIITNCFIFNSILLIFGLTSLLVLIIITFGLKDLTLKTLVYLVLAINCYFVCSFTTFDNFYSKHNLAYVVGNTLNKYEPSSFLVDLRRSVAGVSITDPKITNIRFIGDIPISVAISQNKPPYYVLLKESDYEGFVKNLKSFGLNYQIIARPIDRDNPSVEDIVINNAAHGKFAPFDTYLIKVYQ